MKNIVIIYGGKSCEHDISVITACLARGYFANYNVYGVYLDKANSAYLVPNNYNPAMHVNGKLTQKVAFLTGERAIGIIKRNRIAKRITVDVVVNCCHGRYGEDGTVAALCGLLNVPIVGSNVVSSAVAMDKILSKQVLNSLNLPTVKGFEVNESNVEQLEELTKGYAYPLIVKPNTLGSSIGVAVCKDIEELKHNVEIALKYDNRALVEIALTDFFELNCAAMRTENEVTCSRVDVPTTAHDILTFADKYISSSGIDIARPDVDEGIINQVQALTEQIYSQIGFGGVIRVDYLYDNACKKLYVNEINSIPGSLAYGLFSDVYGMTDYGDVLVKQAERDFAEQGKLTTSFASSVLTASSGAKRGKK